MGVVVDFPKPRDIPRGSIFDRVENHWNALRGGCLVASRNVLEPRSLGPALPDVFVLERSGSGLAQFRVAGSRVRNFFGYNVFDDIFSRCWRFQDRQALLDAFASLFSEPCEIRLEFAISGNVAGHGRFGLWPLRDSSGGITQALGCLDIQDEAVLGNGQLALRDQDRRTLTGYAFETVAQKFARPVLRVV